ncbi:MAG: glycosyltransferase [Fibrobacterota bacterium]
MRASSIVRAFKEKYLGKTDVLSPGFFEDYESELKRFTKETDLSDYRYCYSEPGTYPLKKGDHKFYRALKKAKVPLGVFYRDACWKFGIWSPRMLRCGKEKFLKKYEKDLKIYDKYCDTVFFPTESFSDEISLKVRKEILPPGAFTHNLPSASGYEKKALIYVGGLNDRFGYDIILKIFDQLKNIEKFRMIIICRKSELEGSEKKRIEELDKDKVLFASSDFSGISKYYEKASVALIPRKTDNYYNHIAFPVKLPEYLSFGLPVVCTSCKEQKKFVNENGYGKACETVEDIISSVKSLVEDENLYSRFFNNIKDTFAESHSWRSRVDKIEAILTERL